MKNSTDRVKGFMQYLTLFIGAAIMFLPFFWMINSSFKTEKELLSFQSFFPKQLLIDNFRQAWEMGDFPRYFGNSVFVTVVCVALTMFVTILAAYGFSKLKFPGRDLIFTVLVSMMMIPYEMLMLTNYETIRHMHLFGKIWSLIVPFTSSIFYTYILRNFFLSVPDSLYQSARIDGASDWQYLWEIMVPMAKPSLVTIALLDAITCWNSFMWTMLMSSGNRNIRTLPFGLTAFTSEAGVHYNLWMAGATIVVIPMIILFLFCRKSIITGVSRGGLKG
ncbi:MAG: carbohydrate ABC transporter permease [Erysipelotrichaceae bacterium]|nr:carbohydrate ABC transporter permease [Erysipelotrichaceae bacterium]MBQ1533249.1 carbohydrate ABC transporter permease [Erysipelotrichaceae bacterium]